MGKLVLFPGTFDPPTLGHLNVIERVAPLFDHLHIAIGINVQKKPIFTLEERVALLKKITQSLPHCTVGCFSSLLADYAKEKRASAILRCIRTVSDYEKETVQGQVNKMLAGIDTLYLNVEEPFRHITSTLVKEIASFGKPIDAFIPQEIVEEVFRKLSPTRPLA